MLRPSLFWKIFGSSLALIVLTALVGGWIAERRIVDDIERETRANLRVHVDLITAVIRDRLPSAYDDVFQEEMRALGQRTQTRITLIRPDGVVLADSSKDPRVMDDHSTRPEVVASRTAEYGASTRYSDTLGMRMVYLAVALPDASGGVQAYVRGALPLVRLRERLSGLRRIILGGAGFAVLLGLIVAIVIARRLARPLRNMTEAVSAIAGGDLARRVAAEGSDEVGDLGRRFNEMAARLEQEVATIQRDRQELRAILGGMSEGVIAVDADDRMVLINDAAREMMHVQTEGAAGKHLWETLRLPAAVETIAEAAQHGSVQTAEVRLADAGEERVLQLHASPITDDDGRHIGAVLVVTEITARIQIEAVRRDFIANASHELKTPIASIRGLVETILEDPEMSVDTRESFLQRVVRQISRLGNLVEEMLALSRLESQSGSPVVRRTTDLVAPVREIVGDARPLADERSVTLVTELPDQEVHVSAEPESLRRIAGNLLDNAIKYSGRDSHVTVRVLTRNNEVWLEVEDDGPGIPRDRHDRIFERFYRVDEHRSRRLGGTGLGLAIVKHLVQAHDGQIQVESAPGQGSTFRVVFPAVAVPPAR